MGTADAKTRNLACSRIRDISDRDYPKGDLAGSELPDRLGYSHALVVQDFRLPQLPDELFGLETLPSY